MENKEKSSLKEFLIIATVSIIAVFIVRTFIAQPFVVSGESMEPTFYTGDYLIVDQLSYSLKNPERGDVIVFKYPLLPSRFFIKRIIGLPGETIKIEGENIYIKEVGSDEFKLIDEKYIEHKQNDFREQSLENDEYFVMGDNRTASLDSREWGPLKENYIKGKALFRLYPLNKIEFLPGKK